MADRPIIFSAPTIRALLDGRKTQTRRLAWRAPKGPMVLASEQLEDYELRGWRTDEQPDGRFLLWQPSPWQKVRPGDRLWVRETWSLDPAPPSPPSYAAPDGGEVIYRAYPDGHESSHLSGWDGPWRSPLHMPRWASRLTLVVTATRIERLQDITEADAIAEGIMRRPIDTPDGPTTAWFGIPHVGNATLRDAFADLWDSLHNPHGYCAEDASNSWAANPEVAVLTFVPHLCNIGADDLKAVVFRSASLFTDPTQASIICLGGAAEMLGAAARFMTEAHPDWSEKETRAALQSILLDMAEKAIAKGRTH